MTCLAGHTDNYFPSTSGLNEMNWQIPHTNKRCGCRDLPCCAIVFCHGDPFPRTECTDWHCSHWLQALIKCWFSSRTIQEKPVVREERSTHIPNFSHILLPELNFSMCVPGFSSHFRHVLDVFQGHFLKLRITFFSAEVRKKRGESCHANACQMP